MVSMVSPLPGRQSLYIIKWRQMRAVMRFINFFVSARDLFSMYSVFSLYFSIGHCIHSNIGLLSRRLFFNLNFALLLSVICEI